MEEARDNRIAELEAENAEWRRQLAQLQQQLDKFLQRQDQVLNSYASSD